MSRRSPRLWLGVPAAAAVVGLLATGTSWALASPSPASSPPWASKPVARLPITVTSVACAPGWLAPSPGPTQVVVANQSSRRVTVSLARVRSDAALLSLPVAARSTGRVTRTVAPGTYQFSCHLPSGVVVLSGTQKVGLDPIPGTPQAPPGPGITRGVIAPVIKKYRVYVTGQLKVVSADVSDLASAIGTGSRSAAEQAWYTAFYAWNQLGGALGQVSGLVRPPTASASSDFSPRSQSRGLAQLGMLMENELVL